MGNGKNSTTRKRGLHLRVPVLPDEEAAIRSNAAKAGLSVAAYLRNVALGYEIRSILDYKYIADLAKVNADLGRLGGLLKLWLTNDKRVAGFSQSTILALLAKIEGTQNEMRQIMALVVAR
ncbi:conjugal transfer protein TraJ [Burkholderia ubonensis]|uniref:Conjugal transfer protein TraJ n=1 Tax=Burkholderia pseudomultivorans TaxID=1207504 RepID=A0A132E8S2_9BURK|nr:MULTISPECIES: conjugal transfer transcriptional regulator TraJ [Burkholderia cepacia complex]KVW61716.1 conjugal transfer protein TraJ [Burkholderia ubonensis]KWF21667.1 conjugal transfer protein TraJ [Burkholderia pseudomultivorans]MDI9696178.1 conjugal transfer transcriptional regulator TraJ [Burkholderia cenocepacia]OJB03541.1 conjugal transfer protein TraJ [Burkholderia ubonensis]OJB48857.1 conjugal transfer protein TraJ [Burkholderia ubonensis]